MCWGEGCKGGLRGAVAKGMMRIRFGFALWAGMSCPFRLGGAQGVGGCVGLRCRCVCV